MSMAMSFLIFIRTSLPISFLLSFFFFLVYFYSSNYVVVLFIYKNFGGLNQWKDLAVYLYYCFFIFIFMDSISMKLFLLVSWNNYFCWSITFWLPSRELNLLLPAGPLILMGGCSAESGYEWLITKLPCPPSMGSSWKVIWKLPLLRVINQIHLHIL